jgi:hypothetical protein
VPTGMLLTNARVFASLLACSTVSESNSDSMMLDVHCLSRPDLNVSITWSMQRLAF